MRVRELCSAGGIAQAMETFVFGDVGGKGSIAIGVGTEAYDLGEQP